MTVTISNVVPDWLQAGNFDPDIAWLLAQTELAASPKAFLPRMKDDLRRRGNRFLAQAEKMKPRGRRIPWWRNPGVGKTSGISDDGNRTAAIFLPGAVDNSADTARKRRT